MQGAERANQWQTLGSVFFFVARELRHFPSFVHFNSERGEENSPVCSPAAPAALGNKLYRHLPPTSLPLGE